MYAAVVFKAKDAYNIDHLLGHVGVEEVAAGIIAMGHVDPVVKSVGILAGKFASIDAIEPASVALYRRIPLLSPEADRVQALAFSRVDQPLLRLRRAAP